MCSFKIADAPTSMHLTLISCICYVPQVDLKLRYWQDNKGFDKPDFCRVLSIYIKFCWIRFVEL